MIDRPFWFFMIGFGVPLLLVSWKLLDRASGSQENQAVVVWSATHLCLSECKAWPARSDGVCYSADAPKKGTGATCSLVWHSLRQ